jgi:hypothetical protein
MMGTHDKPTMHVDAAAPGRPGGARSRPGLHHDSGLARSGFIPLQPDHDRTAHYPLHAAFYGSISAFLLQSASRSSDKALCQRGPGMARSRFGARSGGPRASNSGRNASLIDYQPTAVTSTRGGRRPPVLPRSVSLAAGAASTTGRLRAGLILDSSTSFLVGYEFMVCSSMLKSYHEFMVFSFIR